MSVTDEFGASTTSVRDPKRVCGPADENNQDETAPADPEHLIGYETGKATPRFQRIRNQVVVNEFGSVTVDLVRPQLLMMPSATDLTEMPPPLEGTSIDHFQCYQTRGGRTQIGNVPIEDEFGTMLVTVKRPTRLCTPVDANGEGVPNPDARLMCYDVRATTNVAPPGQLMINNDFGPGTVQTFRIRELCVPSFVNPAAAVCGDGAVNAPGEECDGAHDGACPGRCRADCTCAPPPTCGDDSVNQPSEQCDGSDDSACPGQCLADCTCAPAPACGDGVVNQPSEECDSSDDAACPGNCSASCTCLP